METHQNPEVRPDAAADVAGATLPFAPLTLTELNERYADALKRCGFRCVNIVEHDGKFLAPDIVTLRAYATEASTYGAAAMQRVEAIMAQRAEVLAS